MSDTVDYLIVGQGLAGTLLTHELLKAGKTVQVIDANHRGASSAIAAGIINPITGYRFVKSWLLDDLMPLVHEVYGELEQLLGDTFYQDREILRMLFSVREENDWLARTAQDGWSKYVLESDDLGAYRDITHPAFSQGILLGAQVNISRLIKAYQEYLINNDWLWQHTFDYSALEIYDDHVRYGQWEATHIVFCEGHQGTQNPWFSYLPFEVVKGEVLIIRLSDIQAQRILKHKIVLAPLGDDLYWVGANYEHQPTDDLPSEKGRQYLLGKLAKVLLIPYQELQHLAAIRPATYDRRPLLGRHPDHPVLSIFNGLGAKGSSLGPYFARQLAKHLTENGPLHPEAAIARCTTKSKV